MAGSFACTKCGVEQPVENFAKEPRMECGHRKQCNLCRYKTKLARSTPEQRAAYMKAYFQTPSGKAAKRRSHKAWQQSEKGRAYSQRPDVKRYRAAKCAKHRANNPGKNAARNAVRSAKKHGELAPASEHQCNHCGRRASEYHHHNGYDKEHWLDVIPLCRPCHLKADNIT